MLIRNKVIDSNRFDEIASKIMDKVSEYYSVNYYDIHNVNSKIRVGTIEIVTHDGSKVTNIEVIENTTDRGIEYYVRLDDVQPVAYIINDNDTLKLVITNIVEMLDALFSGSDENGN